jgi:hypothetical protein
MAGPYREKIFGVLIKIEVTSGVDSVPVAATDAIRMAGGPALLEWNFMEAGDRDDVQTGILSGADRAAPAGKFGRITLPIEMKGAGAVYSASVKPEAHALWQMSGFNVSTDFTGGAELYRYFTLDSGMVTGTLYLYSENKLFKMVGCVAEPQWGAEVYKAGRISFAVTGKITAVTEITMPALTLSSVIPPLFHSATAAIGAWNTGSAEPLMLLSAAVNMGTVVADLSSAGATDGLAGWLITDRNATQDFVYNAPALATFDPFTQAGVDGSGAVVTAWQVGSVQYNRVKTEARWSPRPPRRGSRNGVATYSQSGQLKVGTGLSLGREIQITYN